MTQKLLHLLTGHRNKIRSLCFVKAASILASVSWTDHDVRTRDVETGTLLHVIQVHNVDALAGSSNHSLIVATTLMGRVVICDAESGRSFPHPAGTVPQYSHLTGVRSSPGADVGKRGCGRGTSRPSSQLGLRCLTSTRLSSRAAPGLWSWLGRGWMDHR